jgi:peptidoglycan/xylan/chitin deacetylase (PgdA/CDA1 family)
VFETHRVQGPASPDESLNELKIPAKRWIRRLKHPGIFLTYDDGPNPAVTPQLLDLLREFCASDLDWVI